MSDFNVPLRFWSFKHGDTDEDRGIWRIRYVQQQQQRVCTSSKWTTLKGRYARERWAVEGFPPSQNMAACCN
jgi:hypothetical protein